MLKLSRWQCDTEIGRHLGVVKDAFLKLSKVLRDWKIKKNKGLYIEVGPNGPNLHNAK